MDILELRVSNNKQLGRGVSLCQLRVLTALLENYSMVEVTGSPHITIATHPTSQADAIIANVLTCTCVYSI